MNYSQAVRFVHSRHKFTSRPGLENMKRLTELCGSPQLGGRFVHVAGTNGKGSVCEMLSEAFVAAGYRTGLYTSPYIVDFRDRFRINGKMISRKAFAGLITELKEKIDLLDSQGFAPNEFEVITAAAFLWFKREGCDRVVLEVGLGGRYDSTNIIEAPECSVITHIALDHTSILGDTFALIAAEKSGIIKRGCPVVSYPDQPEDAARVISDTAARLLSPLTVPALPQLEMSALGVRFDYGGEQWSTAMTGAHQALNAVTAIEAARICGLPDEATRAGIAKAQVPARIEVLSTEPPIILDGAHNPDGMSALADAVKRLCKTPPVLVIGMLADKDYSHALGIIAPKAKRIITLSVPIPRTLTAAELAKEARKYCSDVTPARSYRAAIDAAVDSGEPVVFAGSLYLASSLRPRILKKLENR